MIAPRLRRARRELLLPSALSVVGAAPVSAYYVALTSDTSGRTTGVLLGLVVIAALLLVPWILVRLRQNLRAVWALGAESPHAPQQIEDAVRELSTLPRFVFWSNFRRWAAAVGFLVAGMWVLTDASAGFLLRLLLVGAVLSPLTAFYAQTHTERACRRVLSTLSTTGLSAARLRSLLPRGSGSLRNRLVAITCVFALAPVMLAVDASLVLAGQDLDRVLAEPDPQAQRLLAEQLSERPPGPAFLLGALMAFLAAGLAHGVGSNLREPLREVAGAAGRVAAGEVGEDRVIPAGDECWELSVAFSATKDRVRAALEQMGGASLQLMTASEQLVHSFSEQESSAAEQAAFLNETSATTEELARSAAQIAEGASQVALMAERTLGAAQSGQHASESFGASMHRMRGENDALAEAVVKLNKRMQQIGKIVEFINEIADKSDLLALNAELEGTKAGEVGRGFSLVAAEMRRLAEHVLASTRKIEKLIQEIRDATNGAVMATEAGQKATERGNALADGVLGSLARILELAARTSDAVRSISLATQQQQSGTLQLVDAMADILRVTDQSAGSTRQMRTANEDLIALANDLKASVETLRADQRAGS